MTKESVNHPTHYNEHPAGIECIDVAEHMAFNIGNCIKYIWRAGLKKSADKSSKEKKLEDIAKGIWYLQRELERIEKFE